MNLNETIDVVQRLLGYASLPNEVRQVHAVLAFLERIKHPGELGATTRGQLRKEVAIARSTLEDLERRLEKRDSPAGLIAANCRALAISANDIRELAGRLAGEDEQLEYIQNETPAVPEAPGRKR